MPYPEHLVAPMRAELTQLGVKELLTDVDVNTAMELASSGTVLVVINSVCGCAAGNARPAVAMAKQTAGAQPDHYVTVFAGQDLAATASVRGFLPGIPASSPFMVLLKEGDPVFVLERRNIEGRPASAIATDLVNAYNQFCNEGGVEVTNSSDDESTTFRSIL